MRHWLLDLPVGVDIVLKASEESYTNSYKDLQADTKSIRMLLEQRVMIR
jgi:hypothetical protein